LRTPSTLSTRSEYQPGTALGRLLLSKVWQCFLRYPLRPITPKRDQILKLRQNLLTRGKGWTGWTGALRTRPPRPPEATTQLGNSAGWASCIISQEVFSTLSAPTYHSPPSSCCICANICSQFDRVDMVGGVRCAPRPPCPTEATTQPGTIWAGCSYMLRFFAAFDRPARNRGVPPKTREPRAVSGAGFSHSIGCYPYGWITSRSV